MSVHLLNLPLARTAYSDRTSHLMATLSALAYEKFEDDDQSLRDGLSQLNFNLRATFDESGTQAYLAEHSDFIVLVFRGTEKDFMDILTDLQVRFVSTEAGQMHRGFLEGFKVVEPNIRSALNSLSDKPLYVTGHSLGGALATVGAWRFQSDRLAACYTFGAPPVGDKDLANNIKTPIYRVVNCADIVPNSLALSGIGFVPLLNFLLWLVSLPLQWTRQGSKLQSWTSTLRNLGKALERYHHVGHTYYLMEDGSLKVYEQQEKAFSVFKRKLFMKTQQVFSDHKIAHYIEKLKAIAVLRNPN